MNTLRIALAATLALAATPALAQSAGSWTFGVGAHNVAPKSDNGTLTATPLGNLKMDVGSNVRPTITAEYFVRDNLGVEGLDAAGVEVNEKGAIRVDYRKIDIDTKVKLNGANLGTKNTVNIDPSVYGIAYVFSF